MNSDTDNFSMEENLTIDIPFLAVTACVGSWIISQPCDVRVIVVLIVPDNTLHPKEFWNFVLLTRIACCHAKARQQ